MHNFIGGHHFVFEYIDINEIWISDQIPEEEREKTILHEYVERGLMAQNYSYAKAHRAALEAEGLDEKEVEERSYITPEQIKKDLNKDYPKLKENENEWKVGDKKIIFDETAGIIYVRKGEKIIDQLLVRSSEDIEKFVTKYKADKVEAEVNSIKAETVESNKQVAELQKTVCEMKASVDKRTAEELEYARKKAESDVLLAEKKAMAYSAIAEKWK